MSELPTTNTDASADFLGSLFGVHQMHDPISRLNLLDITDQPPVVISAMIDHPLT